MVQSVAARLKVLPLRPRDHARCGQLYISLPSRQRRDYSRAVLRVIRSDDVTQHSCAGSAVDTLQVDEICVEDLRANWLGRKIKVC